MWPCATSNPLPPWLMRLPPKTVMTEDLSAFTTDFGVNAILSGSIVRGIFDVQYERGDIGIGMASTQPAFTTLTANVVGEAVGQLLVVNGIGYYVAAHEPDGTGMSLLLLEVA